MSASARWTRVSSIRAWTASVGERVGQQGPRPLGLRPAPRVPPGHPPGGAPGGLAPRRPGVSRSCPRPRPVQDGDVPAGQGPRPGPIRRVPSPAAPVRTARPREHRVRCASAPTLTASSQGRVATLEVTTKDTRDPLQERGCRRHDPLRREPARGLVGVGAHLLRPRAGTAAPAARRPTPPRQGHRAGPHPGTASGRPHRPTARPRPAGPSTRKRWPASTATIGCPSIPPRSSSHWNHRWTVVTRPCR